MASTNVKAKYQVASAGTEYEVSCCRVSEGEMLATGMGLVEETGNLALGREDGEESWGDEREDSTAGQATLKG